LKPIHNVILCTTILIGPNIYLSIYLFIKSISFSNARHFISEANKLTPLQKKTKTGNETGPTNSHIIAQEI